MNIKTLLKGIIFSFKERKGLIFKIDNSFYFAAQIPDETVGISGSRCSNCNTNTAYCRQVCKNCNLPLIGPFGFPQLNKWNTLKLDEKKVLATATYYKKRSGRAESAGIMDVPLSKDELLKVKTMSPDRFYSFKDSYGFSPLEIKKILLS